MCMQVHVCRPEDLPQSYLLKKRAALFPRQEFLNSVREEKANRKEGREEGREGGREDKEEEETNLFSLCS